jgi:hypothetical protein
LPAGGDSLVFNKQRVVQSGMATFASESVLTVLMPDTDEKKKPVPAKYLQDYLETLVQAQSFQVSNLRNWTLIQCYAELQFKLNGGTKCPVCRAHVRHIIPVRAEKADGTAKEFTCLCTRCFEAERATSKVVIMKMGDASVTYYPREYGATSHHGKTANEISKASKAKASKK